jgi:hypothetical protein
VAGDSINNLKGPEKEVSGFDFDLPDSAGTIFFLRHPIRPQTAY